MRLRTLGWRRRRWLLVLALVVAAPVIVLATGTGGTLERAAGQPGPAEVVAQADGSVPARSVIMLGSAASGETWGIGQAGSESTPDWTIVHYMPGGGWSVESLLDGQGQPLSGFAPDQGSPLTGEMTASGTGALLGTVTEISEGEGFHETHRQVLLVRDDGHPFHEVQAVPAEMLSGGATLYSSSRAPLLAALDEGEGHAGALVVPVRGSQGGAAEREVLHWDGSRWTVEPIQVPEGQREGFRVLAIGASSPANAWLLGQLQGGGITLYHRALGAENIWKPVAPAPSGTPGEPIAVNGAPLAVSGTGEPPTTKTQTLTVSSGGLWLDGERRDAHALVTAFFKPAGEGHDAGEVKASWCNAPADVPACTHRLTDSLPTGLYRSFAWGDSSTPFGRRVITGLIEDVSLRLEGEEFSRVLALGGGSISSTALGAAFASPSEGWIGAEELPVHLTTAAASSRLERYPVPFHFALLAVAPQPGAPVGSLSSEALAVGDNGEVARYLPGEGWQPETLLGAGGRRATPRLRGVAWPIATRAYAVGESGQLWLWRGETGLWEPDPAAPLNFRGDLLGVAFDPNDPTRGYAVGQQGVLLRYGKSWTQEALPPEVAGASFTSIAFAGSEAIVAFRVPHQQSGGNAASYTGGLLVNDGSGWHVDQAAGAALGTGGVPWAVAALPDGGAALAGENFSEPVVLERDARGGPWKATAAPYPGFSPPGSLALFREGGSLRAIGSGAVPNTGAIDFVPPAPSGFPENLIKPYPAASGYVLRQTASGWSDEEHDRNEATVPPGGYARYDLPYQPDPTAAVIVDPSASAGWAVGGVIESGEGALDTADISRYPADGVPPPGVASTPIQAPPGEATFAVAGNAQCGAPCADRANARLGPDVWLSSALAQASQIAGVRSFMYLGPHLTTGETTTGKVTREIPYTREFGRYAALLGSSGIAAFPAAATTDIAGPTGECGFLEAFANFPAAAFHSGEPCAGQAAYYAFDSDGAAGKVRMIVLDQARSVGDAQRRWLEGQLQEAEGRGEPAIVFGNADLNAQMAAGDPAAIAVVETLVKAKGGASAYFYDSRERNVALPLRFGSASIPSFGTGTLGYVSSNNSQRQDFTGHSGFLVAQVNVAARDPATGRWPVTARLIPNIGELAMEAKDGVLLHRSQPALFAGLARRPRAGCIASGGSTHCESSPYIPIPANCAGPSCATGILPEYSFASSRTDIGDFVQPNLSSPDPHAVLIGPNDKPIHDEQSGLFCAYNAGTTVVTIRAGGLASSVTVTVQAGSVRRPCGTQPLSEVAAQTASAAAPVPPPPAPAPVGPAPVSGSTPPPVPIPAPPAAAAPAPPVLPLAPRPQPPNFFLPPVPPTPVLAFVPPPVPTPARPTPPTGTSAVTSPVEVAEKEEEEEEAPESVSNQAVAYRAADHEPTPLYILGAVLLAAFAGASARRRPRGGRRRVVLAPATAAERRAQLARRPLARRRVNRW